MISYQDQDKNEKIGEDDSTELQILQDILEYQEVGLKMTQEERDALNKKHGFTKDKSKDISKDNDEKQDNDKKQETRQMQLRTMMTQTTTTI